MSESKPHFGKWLKGVRERAGVTQSQLAKALRLESYNSIWHIEKRLEPSMMGATREALLSLLGLSELQDLDRLWRANRPGDAMAFRDRVLALQEDREPGQNIPDSSGRRGIQIINFQTGEVRFIGPETTRELEVAANVAGKSLIDYVTRDLMGVEVDGGRIAVDKSFDKYVGLAVVRAKLKQGLRLTADERKLWIREEGGEPPTSQGSSPTPTPSPAEAGDGDKPAGGAKARRPARSRQRAK